MRTPRPRRGFSVIEVMVAIVLLGVALSSLGILAFGATKKNKVTSYATYRAAVVNEISDRYEALAWTDLVAEQSYDSTITTGPMPHRRRVVIDIPAGTPVRRDVYIYVVPLDSRIAQEEVLVKRYRYSETNPLNMSTP